jgi:putative glutamine amidotransferase
MAQNTVKVAFSKGGPEEKYKQYFQWLQQADKNVECIDMSSLKGAEAEKELADCAGLVLTGGPDIFPGLYKKEDKIAKCEKIDRVRDGQELQLIRKALELKIPIFAICRGAQLMNVSQGGNLIVDISSDYSTRIAHRLMGEQKASHEINIMPKTMLAELVKTNKGTVNSFHHQAVERLSSVFVPFAKAPDDIIEAFGWKDPAGKSFLLAVQWHPERMMDDELFSKRLASKFMEEVNAFAAKQGK